MRRCSARSSHGAPHHRNGVSPPAAALSAARWIFVRWGSVAVGIEGVDHALEAARGGGLQVHPWNAVAAAASRTVPTLAWPTAPASAERKSEPTGAVEELTFHRYRRAGVEHDFGARVDLLSRRMKPMPSTSCSGLRRSQHEGEPGNDAVRRIRRASSRVRVDDACRPCSSRPASRRWRPRRPRTPFSDPSAPSSATSRRALHQHVDPAQRPPRCPQPLDALRNSAVRGLGDEEVHVASGPRPCPACARGAGASAPFAPATARSTGGSTSRHRRAEVAGERTAERGVVGRRAAEVLDGVLRHVDAVLRQVGKLAERRELTDRVVDDAIPVFHDKPVTRSSDPPDLSAAINCKQRPLALAIAPTKSTNATRARCRRAAPKYPPHTIGTSGLGALICRHTATACVSCGPA